MFTILGKKISDTLILCEDGRYLIAQSHSSIPKDSICFFEITGDESSRVVNDTQVAPVHLIENFKRRELLGFPLLKSNCK